VLAVSARTPQHINRWTTLPRFHTIYFPDHCEQVIGLYCSIQGCLDPQEFACMPNRISTSTAATTRPTTATIFISLKTHTSIHTMHICTDIPKTEAGCQRGTNTYQCWPPLQLNDTIQVHKYTKSIKRKETQIVYKLTRVHVQHIHDHMQRLLTQRTEFI